LPTSFFFFPVCTVPILDYRCVDFAFLGALPYYDLPSTSFYLSFLTIVVMVPPFLALYVLPSSLVSQFLVSFFFYHLACNLQWSTINETCSEVEHMFVDACRGGASRDRFRKLLKPIHALLTKRR